VAEQWPKDSAPPGPLSIAGIRSQRSRPRDEGHSSFQRCSFSMRSRAMATLRMKDRERLLCLPDSSNAIEGWELPMSSASDRGRSNA
jgi:hypothetical protein